MSDAPDLEGGGVRYLLPHDLDAKAVHASRIDAAVRSLASSTMGTSWSLRYAAPDSITNSYVIAALERAFSEVINEMSGWEPTSHLSRFNRAAAGSRIILPPHLFHVLSRAVDIAQASTGAFNPALGERIDRMGFGPSGEDGVGVSDRSDIAGWRALALDPETRTATQPGRLALDLSSIGKGYAVDLCADRLDALGVPAFIMEIGGEMRGRGVRPDGQPWAVELELSDLSPAPDEPAHTRVGLIDTALATSGDFVRRRGDASHLIDGRTGGQLNGQLSGVAVLARTCMDADGWATALFALGPVEGLALAERENLAAVFATRTPAGAQITLSSKAQAMTE